MVKKGTKLTGRKLENIRKGKVGIEIFTLKELNKMKEDYLSGSSTVVIAKKFNSSPSTIRNKLVKMNVKMRESGFLKGNKLFEGKIPHNKGKKNIDLYGKEKAEEFSRERSNFTKRMWRQGNFKNNIGRIPVTKDKTLEEYYGFKRAREIRKKQSNSAIGKHYKDLTYEQIHGDRKARIIKNKIGRKASARMSDNTYEEMYGEKEAKRRKMLTSKRMKCKYKNISHIERFGEEKAKKISKKLSNARINKSYEEIFGKEKAELMIKEKEKSYVEKFGERRAKIISNKISKSNINKIVTLKTRKKISKTETGKFVSQETREKNRNHRLTQKFPVEDSRPERIIQDFLVELGVDFITQLKVKGDGYGYQCDIYIPLFNLVIECYGDVVHFHPSKFDAEDRIYNNGMTAKERWEYDKIRIKRIKNNGYNVLILWESKINKMVLEDFVVKIV